MGKQYECQLKRKRRPMSPEKMTAYLEKQERAKRKRELMRLYANNPERRREHRKESRRLWKETNPEKYDAELEKQRLSYANNPERAKRKREMMRLWHAKNGKAYMAKNPEKAKRKREDENEKQRLEGKKSREGEGLL